jgi:hypothetical protein
MGNTVSRRQFLVSFCLITATILAGQPTIGSAAQTIFFTESFDNANFASRGWYDVTTGTIDTTVFSPTGGNSSLNIHWAAGATTPTAPRRHLFTASDTVYVSFWMKLGTSSATWRGSGVSYHPHIIQLLTNADDDWIGPSNTNLSMRIETGVFTPRINFQDSLRLNTAQLGVNLLGTATAHAIAGGNGTQVGTNATYWNDGEWWNDSNFNAASAAFVNNTWHHVEFYVAMNSISGGIPQANGILKYWVDGSVVIGKTNMYLRTAQFATQKFNKLLLVPYIGDGSPIAQDMWIDNLVVADQIPTAQTSLPPPTNLRVQ